MPTFEEHIGQAVNNLSFLSGINNKIENCWDWQVTACFYTSLHFVNAHLSQYGLQYRKHSDVNNALNFANQLSPGRLPEDIYISYMSLQSLSRRSRYLVNEKDKNLKGERAFYIYEKHLSKALLHLEVIINHFCARYKLNIESKPIKCSEVRNKEIFSHLKIN